MRGKTFARIRTFGLARCETALMSNALQDAAPQVNRQRLVIGAVVVALPLALGVYAGMQLPWGETHADPIEGVAMRAASDTDLVLFDGNDSTQLQFGAEDIWWESSSSEGSGNPPCLRQANEKVDVVVGLLRVARPDGGSFDHAVWVKCP